MIRPGQFTLRNLLIATAFFALACAAARLASTGDLDQPGRLFAADTMIIAVCGAIGVLRGRLWEWLTIGLAIAVVFLIASGRKLV